LSSNLNYIYYITVYQNITTLNGLIPLVALFLLPWLKCWSDNYYWVKFMGLTCFEGILLRLTVLTGELFASDTSRDCFASLVQH